MLGETFVLHLLFKKNMAGTVYYIVGSGHTHFGLLNFGDRAIITREVAFFCKNNNSSKIRREVPYNPVPYR